LNNVVIINLHKYIFSSKDFSLKFCQCVWRGIYEH